TSARLIWSPAHSNASSSFLLLMANLSLTPKQLLRAIVAVFVGGSLGTLLRDFALKIDAVPKVSHLCLGVAILTSSGAPDCPRGTAPVWWFSDVPWTLLVINALGVFVVTRLLRTSLRGRDAHDLTRLFVVTGFFGGFTSYSALFSDVAPIWHLSHIGATFVIAVAMGTGISAAWLGLGRRKART
ncbi:MAG TPA: CrcB family protein, partial [Acidimicrobiales bacterium]|nr:CrcB family protein [Acidimicrobiales bacterium]